ncbi:MAG: hypothetical protein M0C28_48890 [Candidatus Moduliflexus flocculans]|nr:hypothetical protein [Candidatus Moduliflexus flocculans]
MLLFRRPGARGLRPVPEIRPGDPRGGEPQAGLVQGLRARTPGIRGRPPRRQRPRVDCPDGRLPPSLSRRRSRRDRPAPPPHPRRADPVLGRARRGPQETVPGRPDPGRGRCAGRGEGFRGRSVRIEAASALAGEAEKAVVSHISRYLDPDQVKSWKQAADETIAESKRRGITVIIVSKLERRLAVYRNGGLLSDLRSRAGLQRPGRQALRRRQCHPRGAIQHRPEDPLQPVLQSASHQLPQRRGPALVRPGKGAGDDPAVGVDRGRRRDPRRGAGQPDAWLCLARQRPDGRALRPGRGRHPGHDHRNDGARELRHQSDPGQLT